MKKLFGTYIGKVVDNNDPEKSGRVKVFCTHPEINNYYSSLLSKTTTQYKFPGNDDFSSDFINIIKPYLPWARIQQPLVGGSAPAKFDAQNNKASRTDDTESFTEEGSPTYNVDGYPITPMEALRYVEVSDAFAFPSATMCTKGNAYGATDYMAPTYVSKPTGMFNIPRVGATVSIQFLNGDINKPIITGNMIDSESSKLIMNDGNVPIGVPGDFENI
jgi:hypothetical protein